MATVALSQLPLFEVVACAVWRTFAEPVVAHRNTAFATGAAKGALVSETAGALAAGKLSGAATSAGTGPLHTFSATGICAGGAWSEVRVTTPV
jgi:hypothetical protein